MGRRTRECLLCGTKYEYCHTCSQDKIKPTWMAEFHDENCKNIFDICTRFNMELMTKDEAKKALSVCDLSKKEAFKSYVQRDLSVIFTEEPKAKRNKTPVKQEELTVEATEAHEVVNKTEE